MANNISQSEILFQTIEIFNSHKVKALLIGGQACVIYGAKVSTVDIDFTILVDEKNLKNLKKALDELAVVPSTLSAPIDKKLLSKGHSLHYYSAKKGFDKIRIDIIGYLPQLPPFPQLWKRRFEYKDINIISLKDLVLSKKTGRLKDILDISSLIRADYTANKLNPIETDIDFWLLQARDSELVRMLITQFKPRTKDLIKKRPLLKYALKGDDEKLEIALSEENRTEALEHQKFRKPIMAETKELSRRKRKK